MGCSGDRGGGRELTRASSEPRGWCQLFVHAWRSFLSAGASEGNQDRPLYCSTITARVQRFPVVAERRIVRLRSDAGTAVLIQRENRGTTKSTRQSGKVLHA